MNRPSASDDGLTVIRTGPTGGPASDFAPSSTRWSDSLPEGLRLGEYEIRSVIGEGGFGIVYLAYDHFLQRQVALKEYMPSTLAGRARTGLDVVVKAERHRETFLAGLRSFVNEARLLAQFDHPALVKVYRFWEAHGTAYMVMPYCIGPTLKEALASHDGPPDEGWLRDHLLGPLLEALALLHKTQCLHRDIAPDNILLTDTGPLLLDFGAARQIIGDMSQTLTVVLKPGYAPIEQYGEVASMGQGAWTDLYALAGVVRYAITGKVPVAATSRIMQDTLVPLTELAAGQYGEIFLRTIDVALAVKPADRPQNVTAFQALLDGVVSEQAPRLEEGRASQAAAAEGLSAPRAGMPAVAAGVHMGHAPAEPATRTGPRSWSPTTTPGSGQATSRTGAATRPSPLDALASVAAATRGAATGPASARGNAKADAGDDVHAGSRPGLVSLLSVGLVTVALGGGGWMFLSGPGASDPVLADPAPVASPAEPSIKQTAAPSAALPAAMASAASPSPSALAHTASGPAAAIDAAATSQPAVSSTTPATARAAMAAPAATTAPSPATPTPARVADATPSEQPVPLEATPKRASPPPDRSARCSDILQKASLEPLSASEAAFLKSECR